MPTFERDGVALHYIERGDGFPVLLFAPGGMRSAAGFWKNSPWNPVEELPDRYRVIAMDQRNAGRSRAPVRDGDGRLPARASAASPAGGVAQQTGSVMRVSPTPRLVMW